jgi:GH25 family lysozyme M1 (1,4-beta-N-acetylmuramidase)
MSLHAQPVPARRPAALLAVIAGLALALLAAAVPVARAAPAAGQVPTLPAGSRGIDVSGWQHPNGAAVDWGRVAASGVRFAVVKATELTGSGLYSNPWFASDVRAAHAAGLVVGAYAYGHPELPAGQQADALARATGVLPARSLPAVLDLEISGGLSAAALRAWTQQFLDRFQHDTGTVPMIYAAPVFWNTAAGGTTAFARYPLWEAHYTSAPAPDRFGGWRTYTLWQYGIGSVPGISAAVDLDRSGGAVKLGA